MIGQDILKHYKITPPPPKPNKNGKHHITKKDKETTTVYRWWCLYSVIKKIMYVIGQKFPSGLSEVGALSWRFGVRNLQVLYWMASQRFSVWRSQCHGNPCLLEYTREKKNSIEFKQQWICELQKCNLNS